MTIGPKPKAGKDERPWECTKEDGTIIRCWYEDTAKELVRMKVCTSYINRKNRPLKKRPKPRKK